MRQLDLGCKEVDLVVIVVEVKVVVAWEVAEVFVVAWEVAEVFVVAWEVAEVFVVAWEVAEEEVE